MNCHACGTELSADAAFCSSCGTAVENAGDDELNVEPDGGVGTGSATDDASSNEIVGGLDQNVAGALAYVLGWVSGLVFYVAEEDDEFVRFHAAQSIIVFGTLTLVVLLFLPVLGFVFEPIPVVGSFVGLFLWFLGDIALRLGGFALWLILLIKAYQGERFALPIVGEMAEDYV